MIGLNLLWCARISFLILVSCLGSFGAPLTPSTLLEDLPFAIPVEHSIQGRLIGFDEKIRERHLQVLRNAFEVLAIYGQNHPESNILGWKKENGSIALKKMFLFLTDRDTVIVRDPLKSGLASVMEISDDAFPIPSLGRFRSAFVPNGSYSMMQYFVLGLRLDNCLYEPDTFRVREDAFARTVSRLANTLFGQATPFLTDDPLQRGAGSTLGMSAWSVVTMNAANEKEWEFLGWLLQQSYLDTRFPGQRRYLEEQRAKARYRVTAATLAQASACGPQVADGD